MGRCAAFNYQESLSWNQVKIILTELRLDFKAFHSWYLGVCKPNEILIPRLDKRGDIKLVEGIPESRLFEWIRIEQYLKEMK